MNWQHRHIWYKKRLTHKKTTIKSNAQWEKGTKKKHTLIEKGRKKFCSAMCLRAAWKKTIWIQVSVFFFHSYCSCAKLHLIFTFLFKHSFISMICEISKLFFFSFCFSFSLKHNTFYHGMKARCQPRRDRAHHRAPVIASPRLAHQRRTLEYCLLVNRWYIRHLIFFISVKKRNSGSWSQTLVFVFIPKKRSRNE